MFGELIGLWAASVWQQMGAPENVRLVELGPGRGTLLRTRCAPQPSCAGFRDAVVVHLVEINAVLKAQQERTLEHLDLATYWHTTLAEVPDGPAIILANEFFDALPVHQAVKTQYGWHERQIEIGPDGRLVFTLAAAPIRHFERLLPEAVRSAPDGSIFEWRSETAALDIGRRVARDGGAALVIDYGHGESAVGDTLQAVARHAYADPLTAPGTVDLTAHVDFQALARAAEAMGAKGMGRFRRRCSCASSASRRAPRRSRPTPHAPKRVEIDAALERLTGLEPHRHGHAVQGHGLCPAGASGRRRASRFRPESRAP